MNAYLFNSQGEDRRLESDERFSEIGDDQLLWVQLLKDERLDPAPYGLPEGIGRPSTEDHAVVVGSGWFVARCLGFADDGRRTSDVTATVGPNWLVTRCDEDQPVFQKFLEEDSGKGLRGNLTGTGLLVSLMLASFEGYQARITEIADAVDRLDAAILKSRARRRMLDRLADLRDTSSRLRRSFVRNRALIHSLLRPDFSEAVSERDAIHIAHLSSVYERIEDQISETREEVLASFELYTTKVAQDTNELIKILTIVAVTTGLVGAVAGLMGMNVEVPLQHSGARGFYVLLGIMASMVLTVMAVARLKKWI